MVKVSGKSKKSKQYQQ